MVLHRQQQQWCIPNQRRWTDTKRILTNNFRDWHDRPFTEISKSDARTVIRQFIADGHAAKAAVSLAWIRKLWRWASAEEIVPAAIMDLGITVPKRSRDRVYNDDEIKAIWHAADGLDDTAKGTFFKLLVLLAPRKSALSAMKWTDLKDDGRLWITPWESVKAKKSSNRKRTYLTPLPALAQRILSACRELPNVFSRVCR
jgi:integrase